MLRKQGLSHDTIQLESMMQFSTKLQLMSKLVDQLEQQLVERGCKLDSNDGGVGNAGITTNPSPGQTGSVGGGGSDSGRNLQTQVKMEQNWSPTSYMISGGGGGSPGGTDGDSLEADLQKTLRILNVGEMVLNYLYECQLRIFILKKLAMNLLMMKQYVVENKDKLVE